MGTLTSASLKRLVVLYIVALLILGYAAMQMYPIWNKVTFSELSGHPDYSSFWSRRRFYEAWYQIDPNSLIFIVILFFVFFCCLLCSGYALVRPLLGVAWPILKKVFPCRIRRRAWCFCNCSFKSLEKILTGICHNYCDWIPQRPDNLDKTTKSYIESILKNCQQSFGEEDMSYLLVGSSAEGLGKPYTLDLNGGDIVHWRKFCLRFFCCLCPFNTAYNSLRTDFDIIMQSMSSSSMFAGAGFRLQQVKRGSALPGFVQLEVSISARRLSSICVNYEGKTYLSSKLIRQKITEIVNDSSEKQIRASTIFGIFRHLTVIELEEHGPAVKLLTYPMAQAWYWNEDQFIVSFEGDFVFGIHFPQEWPKSASRWPQRPRQWLLDNEVNEIVKMGFVLVPKSSHLGLSPEDEIEWYMSFPHCETFLSLRMPRVAKACYLAMKLIFKQHLVYHCEDFKSYYLKTIFLWELEKHPADFWSIDNIVEGFECLLDSVYHCVNHKSCPHYWLDSYNLFDKIDRKDLGSLTGLLANIKNNPAPYIEDIGSLWC